MCSYSPSRCPTPQADVFYSDDDADGFAAGTSCSSPGARRGSFEQRRSSFDRRRASLDRPSLSRASLDRAPLRRASLDCSSSLALPAQHWADGEWQSYRVRGSSYLSGPRLKTPASQPACTLVGVDLCSTPHSQSREHLASHPNSWMMRRRRQVSGGQLPDGALPFHWVVHFMNPGSPGLFPCTSICLYFAAADGATLPQLLSRPGPLSASLRRFLGADATEQAAMFKMIPAVASGPALVRSMVPRTPIVVGKTVRLPVHVASDGAYVEVGLDVASSGFADRFFRHVFHRFTARVVVDIAFLLEGQRVDELPEQLLGVAHLANVAPHLAVPLPGL